jgi:hypothetical protein
MQYCYYFYHLPSAFVLDSSGKVHSPDINCKVTNDLTCDIPTLLSSSHSYELMQLDYTEGQVSGAHSLQELHCLVCGITT